MEKKQKKRKRTAQQRIYIGKKFGNLIRTKEIDPGTRNIKRGRKISLMR